MYPNPPAVDVYRLAGCEQGVDLPRDEVARRFQAAFRANFSAGDGATSHEREFAKWRRVVGSVFPEAPDRAGVLFDELWKHFGDSRNWSLFGDVPEVWRELESCGYRVGVASNYDDRLLAVLVGLPPLDRCRDVFWSSQIGYAKPHPQFFHRVAARLHLPPEKILLVGDDRENDFLGASQAGWRAVLLDRTGQLRHSGAIAHLAEVVRLCG